MTHSPANDSVSCCDNSKPYSYIIRGATIADLHNLPDIESSAAKLFLSDPDLAPIADDGPMSVDTHEELLSKWTALGPELGEGGTWVAIARWGGSDAEGQEHAAAKEEVVGFVVTTLLVVERRRTTSVIRDGVVANARAGGSGNVLDTTAEVDSVGAELYFLHIEELSIHAAHQRKGLAGKLLRAVKECAENLSVATLSMRGLFRVVGLSLTTMRDVAFNGPFYARIGFREIPVDGEGGIVDVVGERGWDVWQGDQKHFGSVGDGKLRARRCWMVLDMDPK